MLAPTLVTWRVLYSLRSRCFTFESIDLPGDLARLRQHGLAVFGVGVVAEIGALVDEALAFAC